MFGQRYVTPLYYIIFKEYSKGMCIFYILSSTGHFFFFFSNDNNYCMNLNRNDKCGFGLKNQKKKNVRFLFIYTVTMKYKLDLGDIRTLQQREYKGTVIIYSNKFVRLLRSVTMSFGNRLFNLFLETRADTLFYDTICSENNNGEAMYHNRIVILLNNDQVKCM